MCISGSRRCETTDELRSSGYAAGGEGQTEGLVVSAEEYGVLYTAPSGVPPEDLGNAVHAWMLLSPDRAGKKMKEIFAAYGITDENFLQGLQENRKLFEEYIRNTFGYSSEFREYPLRMQTGGNLISGQADLVLRTETGTVIIDHKTFTGDDAALRAKTLTYAPQLGWYRKVVESAGGWSAVSTYVNFICAGKVAEVRE